MCTSWTSYYRASRRPRPPLGFEVLVVSVPRPSLWRGPPCCGLQSYYCSPSQEIRDASLTAWLRFVPAFPAPQTAWRSSTLSLSLSLETDCHGPRSALLPLMLPAFCFPHRLFHNKTHCLILTSASEDQGQRISRCPRSPPLGAAIASLPGPSRSTYPVFWPAFLSLGSPFVTHIMIFQKYKADYAISCVQLLKTLHSI